MQHLLKILLGACPSVQLDTPLALHQQQGMAIMVPWNEGMITWHACGVAPAGGRLWARKDSGCAKMDAKRLCLSAWRSCLLSIATLRRVVGVLQTALR